MPEADPEIGRELKAHELAPRTVYVLSKPGRPSGTMWFVERIADLAVFRAGQINMTLLLRIQDDGSMRDETDTMTVYEYLGKV